MTWVRIDVRVPSVIPSKTFGRSRHHHRHNTIKGCGCTFDTRWFGKLRDDVRDVS